MRSRTSLVLSFVILGAAPLAAQSPLVGTWRVTYPAGARIENGERTVIMANATLQVSATGDSLVGTLANDPSPDMPERPPVRLAGVAGKGPVSLVSNSSGSINMNGQQRAITVISTWSLEVRGDSLLGTVARRVEGVELPENEPGEVRGARKAG